MRLLETLPSPENYGYQALAFVSDQLSQRLQTVNSNTVPLSTLGKFRLRQTEIRWGVVTIFAYFQTNKMHDPEITLLQSIPGVSDVMFIPASEAERPHVEFVFTYTPSNITDFLRVILLSLSRR
jgi:hypothetical protein